ncbi:mannitol dehydrogenase Rossmann domain-containing protein [Lachnospiraceae bacterium 5_1_63FAA]|nr:mannitol dehydrogenase Rossmann domain-containing protein [Lachnospiraceae bacterium 5_1_63FAA]
MKAVHFGAGKIGRGFIADLIHETGYEITFVDVNEKLNDELNKYHNYYLYLIEDNYQRKEIDHVSALSPITQPEEVTDAIVEADLVTTAVLADNFPKIARSLAQGLKARLEAGKTKVNVIPCENALFCGDMLKEEIIKTGIITKEELDQIAAVPNTAVDRMVFGTDRDGRDGIEIGKDYELVIEVDKLADPQNLPIKGPEYTDNLKNISRENYIRSMGDMPGQDILHI